MPLLAPLVRMLWRVATVPDRLVLPRGHLHAALGTAPDPRFARLARWRGRLGALLWLPVVVAAWPSLGSTEVVDAYGSRFLVGFVLPVLAVLPPLAVLLVAALRHPRPGTVRRLLGVAGRALAAVVLLVVVVVVLAAPSLGVVAGTPGSPSTLVWMVAALLGVLLALRMAATAPVHFFGAADGHLWLPPLATVVMVWLSQALSAAVPGAGDRMLAASGLPTEVRLLLGTGGAVVTTALAVAEMLWLRSRLGVSASRGAGVADGG